MIVQDTLTNIQNNTTAVNAAKSKETMGKSEMSQDAFLQLMMTQLKYQDPLNPMDNSEMLNQQAQFTQISELQKLNDTISGSNTLMQASTLIGKEVTITDPDNEEKTITGTVTEARMDSGGANIVLNDTSYPLDFIQSVK